MSRFFMYMDMNSGELRELTPYVASFFNKATKGRQNWVPQYITKTITNYEED